MKFFICTVMVLIASVTFAQQVPFNAAGAYPTDYAKLIKAYIDENAVDPDSVKIYEITKPTIFSSTVKDGKGGLVKEEFWVCDVTWNAKNKMGGYSGKSTSTVMFRDGKLHYFGE
jgi:hypothetical protein